jgi:hypothetical protein
VWRVLGPVWTARIAGDALADSCLFGGPVGEHGCGGVGHLAVVGVLVQARLIVGPQTAPAIPTSRVTAAPMSGFAALACAATVATSLAIGCLVVMPDMNTFFRRVSDRSHSNGWGGRFHLGSEFVTAGT